MDRHKLPAPDYEVGFHVYSDVLPFHDALLKVFTRDRLDSLSAMEAIKVVKEEYPSAEVFPLTDAPGIAFSKAASVRLADADVAGTEGFFVNIPAVGIKREKHHAKNADEAVNQALYKAWRATKQPFRNAKYTLEYWKNSGFWLNPDGSEAMVWSAKGQPHTAMRKEAEAMTLCGAVVKKRYGVGSKSERDAIMLQTPKTEFLLRISGSNPLYDETLDKMVGRTICGIGLVHGSTFIMSEWNDLKSEQDDSVVKMHREDPEDVTIFKEGDRVRKRNRGISFKQINGVVEDVKDGLMYVRWDNIKDLEVFKLTDTVQLHARGQKTSWDYP